MRSAASDKSRPPLKNLMAVLEFGAYEKVSKTATELLLAVAKVELYDRPIRDWLRLLEEFEAVVPKSAETIRGGYRRRSVPCDPNLATVRPPGAWRSVSSIEDGRAA